MLPDPLLWERHRNQVVTLSLPRDAHRDLSHWEGFDHMPLDSFGSLLDRGEMEIDKSCALPVSE